MTETVDPHTGQTWIQLNDDEIRFGFLAQCIEALADAEKCNYVDMLHRLENSNMTEGIFWLTMTFCTLSAWKI